MKKWISPNGQIFLAPDGHDIKAVYVVKELYNLRLCAGDAHRFLLRKGFKKQ